MCSKLKLARACHMPGPENDNQLSLKHQAQLTSAKINRKIGALKRAQLYFSTQAKRFFLTAVILPEIDYTCSSIGCGLLPAARNSLARLERRAVRVACDADYNVDCGPLYDHLKITPLKER